MKAVEFVKKFGWFGSKEYLVGTPFFDGDVIILTDRSELEQLIKTKELVDSFGGLKKVKLGISIPCCFGDSDFFQDVTLENLVQLLEIVENE